MSTTVESKRTKDHKTIKNWVEARDGKPSVVEATTDGDSNSGLLRIDFPQNDNDSLKELSWEEFFDVFDDNDIEFLYQEQTKDGEKSNFCKFVSAN